MTVQTVTEAAKRAGSTTDEALLEDVEIVTISRAAERPSGRRFGTLVHAVLASVPLACDFAVIQDLAAIHGRILGATAPEIESAADCVRTALAHPIFDRAREAAAQGRCRREVPVVWDDGQRGLSEGVVDLAFEEDGAWTVIDFKTDEEFRQHEPVYRRQIAMYASAVHAATGARVSALLMRV